ncbi:MAG: tRNA 4-thiouridine(8) synthase ThiI [Lachnospiraceae bacterium]|nr:tRNA 4-thiouridine(8) synthase ThiI [Lachnospiraceae bacterium]MDE6625711.1 tRNA 4-thiouridine(8) synthase ThiI [Lachnospiraceae bacterium]
MEYRSFLIKYAEIGTKGKNRYVFEDVLCTRIKEHVASLGEFSIRREYGRIFLNAESDYDYEDLMKELKKVFGIVGICPIVVEENIEFEAIRDKAVTYMKECYGEEPKTFKVYARRANKSFPMQSMEINSEVGHFILEACPNMKVDVHKPDILLNIELREKVYIYSHTIKGAGGLPVGTNGKAMLLLSGGIDSPVAGYMISKRGVELDAVYFHAPPYTSERAKQKVIDLAKRVSAYSGSIRLHIVNFTDIQLAIYEKCPHEELTIIMRRYMMRIAQSLAGKNGCQALVTGESIGQVASQTMHSLVCTDEVCTMPVFRPCIGMDKQEIVDISEEISTYETSILPYEDCCTIFVAKHPVTKPVLDVIKRSETGLDGVIDGLVEEAMDSVQVVNVRADSAE